MKSFILTAILASTAFTGTLNRDGVAGINKTFSAKTLGHGKLGLGGHFHFVNDEMTIRDGAINVNGTPSQLEDYLTLSTSLFLSLGLGPYTDIGLALPLYYEKFDSDNSGLDMDQQQLGDLRYRLKVQLPLDDLQVLHVAVLLGGSVPTQFEEKGVIPRELEYMTDDPSEFNHGSSPFGAGRPTFLAG